MPATAPVEDLPPARAQEREDMLEVRGRACGGAECRRIEGASPRRQEEDGSDAAADLEPTGADVLVRHAVAREVENRSEQEGRES
jgi:hypothetical protein